MFFNKATTNHISPTDQVIYILGSNALAFFLGARFINAGEKVIFLNSDKDKNQNSSELLVKDERFINRYRYTPEFSVNIRHKVKMLVITEEASTLKAQISGILTSKINNIPILIFTRLEDDRFIAEYLHHSLIRGYFNGCLQADKNTVSLIGTSNRFTLVVPKNDIYFSTLKDIFTRSEIETEYVSDEKGAFWSHLASFGSAALLSAANGKNIYLLTKDENSRKTMDALIAEMQKLASSDKVNLEYTDILKTIYNMPSAYVTDLQQAITEKNFKEIDLFSNLLNNRAQTHHIQIPTIKHLLGLLYNKTLV